MASVTFSHGYVGSLSIDTGIDSAQWAYGLNTVTFPTYGGEVVQILSVYIDDLTLTGTVTTYSQLGAIYSYFAAYMQAASQGRGPNPTANPGLSSYNLEPMLFNYAERNWTFKIYPKAAPGYMLDLETAAPKWQVVCHVIDNSPDLDIIKEGIRGAATASINAGLASSGASGAFLGKQQITISGEISPAFGNPNTDPFQTFDLGANESQQTIQKYADYYNHLIPAYLKGDFTNLTGIIGSAPNTGLSQQGAPNQAKVNIPKIPTTKGH